MLDGIELERRGVPTAAIVTEPFQANAQTIAEAHGAQAYSWIVAPHPISNATPDELRDQAGRIFPELFRLLSASQRQNV